MMPTIEHGAEGTLVHGTSRDDSTTIDVLKGNGFRWSRRLEAWYLPRNLRPESREARVSAVVRALGDRVRVERPDGGARQTAAQREAARQERAAERADRMTSRAEHKQAEADTAYEASRRATAGIPLGQPILLGHHSQRNHERALERSRSQMDKSLAAQQQAERARAAAERATRTASGKESVVTIDNRIQRNEAELRRVDRLLAGTASPGQGPASGEYADQLRDRREQLLDQIGFDTDKLEAAGGINYGKHNVAPGDLVNAVGRWLPVVRANAKTVTVPTGYSWTDTVPWSKVRSVTKAEDFSPAQAAQLLDDAGDDQHRRAALEKTLARAEQAGTDTASPARSPGVADEALPFDTLTAGETSRAEQRLRQHPHQQHLTLGAPPSTPPPRR